jgi:hypothetical protein
VATGAVEAALSTVGPDGAVYSLLPSTELNLTSGGATQALYFFSSPSGTQTFSVPVGNYTASFAANLDANAWQLSRTAGGVTTTVIATLLDAEPYAFTVVPGGTTPLTFHFSIPVVGDVTFSVGNLAVGLQVEAGAVAGTSIQWNTTAATNQQTFDPNVAAALKNLLQVPNGTMVQATINFTRTGAWTATADQVCATGTATVTTPSSTPPGIAANLQELTNSTGTVCVNDPNTHNYVQINLVRDGSPRTSAFITALSGDGGVSTDSFKFTVGAIGTPPTPLFSGGVLSLSTAAAGVSMTFANLSMMVWDTTTDQIAFTETVSNPADGGVAGTSAIFTVAP